MKEAELIKKIQELRKISPRKDWVSFTKSQILGKEPELGVESISVLVNKISLIVSPLIMAIFYPFRFSFKHYKPVLAVLVFLFIVFSTTFTLAQNSLPGDLLFPIKKLAERSRAVFVSEKEKPGVQFELVNKRLEELARITENNQTQKLASSLNEVKNSKETAKKELSKAIANKSKTEAIKIAKEIAPKLIEIGEKEAKVYTALGVEPPEEDKEGMLDKETVELLINDLKNSSLTDLQKNILTEAEKNYEAGNFSAALEKVIEASQTK
jgi:hypothetical protein